MASAAEPQAGPTTFTQVAAALAQSRREDARALIEAGRMSVAGVQALLERRIDTLREALSELRAVSKLMRHAGARETVAHVDELARGAVQLTLAACAKWRPWPARPNEKRSPSWLGVCKPISWSSGKCSPPYANGPPSDRANVPSRKARQMHLENLSIGSDPPNEVNAVIEVPVGGEPIKYETDKAAGMLVVDRFLYTPMRYPGNYGFIPHTLSEDGDPCDVLVANTRPLMPGCAIAVRPVGVLKMVDESGGDEKIVAVPVSRLTQRYGRVHNYTDLPEILWRQIEHFFAHYKDLEPGKWSKFDGWGDAEHAKDLIEQAIARASKLQRVRERL